MELLDEWPAIKAPVEVKSKQLSDVVMIKGRKSILCDTMESIPDVTSCSRPNGSQSMTSNNRKSAAAAHPEGS